RPAAGEPLTRPMRSQRLGFHDCPQPWLAHSRRAPSNAATGPRSSATIAHRPRTAPRPVWRTSYATAPVSAPAHPCTHRVPDLRALKPSLPLRSSSRDPTTGDDLESDLLQATA